MFRHTRPVRFEDVDAAALVFFGRYFSFCHEAMESFFDPLPGGYARLITERRLGVPAVHVDVQYTAPARYGDRLVLDVDVTQIGRTSTTLRYAIHREADGVQVALVTHKVVCCDLRSMTPVPLPDDVRAILAAHHAA